MVPQSPRLPPQLTPWAIINSAQSRSQSPPLSRQIDPSASCRKGPLKISPAHRRLRTHRQNLRPVSHLVSPLILALSLAAFAPNSIAQSFSPAQSLPPESSPQPAQSPQPSPPAIDSDHDGISDDLEQSLLLQFAPKFLIGSHDCSNIPAEFQPGDSTPLVKSENGTIYGQVFPATDPVDGAPAAEIHYYHLWRIDCGPHGHLLDTEHVAVLVRANTAGADPARPDLAPASNTVSADPQPASKPESSSSPASTSATWKALYWYAAAHENTVCDVSQIARASTLHAENSGPSVWISPGKHASYLNQALCEKGCGADRCENMTALAPAKLINLGEATHPMNGSVFIASSAWPLSAKMSETNFPPTVLARLNELPDSDIAWFNAGKHPKQGIIAISSTTGRDALGGLDTAADATDNSLSIAHDSTGNALHKSYRHTTHALGTSAQHVGEALGLKKKQAEKQPAPTNPPPADSKTPPPAP